MKLPHTKDIVRSPRLHEGIALSERVKVVAVDGLMLQVERVPEA